MGKKIARFLAFDNGREDWRKKEEETYNTGLISKKIADIRKGKPNQLIEIDAELVLKTQERVENWVKFGSAGLDSSYISLIAKKKEVNDLQEVKDYRKKMHEAKGERQKNWIEHLMDKVILFFEEGLEKYNNYRGDDIFVLMLPEFFWTDIVDNRKFYEIAGRYREIAGYVSPLYENEYEMLLASNNKIVEWMKKQNKNILFFAGTAMHKEFNQDPMQEKIYNTLLIYSVQKGREVQIGTWNKVNYSPIDGFSINGYVVREKIPYVGRDVIGVGEKALRMPVINYDELVFSFDICLDYVLPDGYSVSNWMLSNQKADFNILIAGGMPIMSGNISNKSAIHTIRCDKVSYDGETCCSVRIENWHDAMKDIRDTSIRYADFEVVIENNRRTITKLS